MIKTGKELAMWCLDVARNFKTLYVMGAFGWPLNKKNKQRAINSYAYNRGADRKKKIESASEETFAFDCVCLIKALLWGWNGNSDHVYGGAVYASNGVQDINEDSMINMCKEVSADFGRIAVGEVVWMPGHIGVYVGDGLAVECTPSWENGAQITAVHNIGRKRGYNGREWKTHGKLPWVSYEAAEATTSNAKKGDDYTLGFDYLRTGSKGEAVAAVQALLIARGYSCGPYGQDGDFGEATAKAVRSFQADCEIEVDGVVGKDTMSRLLGV